MTKNVLVVEDSVNLLRSIQCAFKEHAGHYNLLVADNGEAAVNILGKTSVAVLVTDLYMPQMDGLELLAFMSREHPDIPCIVMTAFSSPDVMEILANLKIFRFLSKPFELDELFKGINAAIEAIDRGKENESLSASGFLGLLEEDQRSCTLEAISREGLKGYFYLVDGRLYDAKCEGLLGEEAATKILGWDKVSLKLRDLPSDEIRARIQLSLKGLISKVDGPNKNNADILEKKEAAVGINHTEILFRAISRAESGDFHKAQSLLARILKTDSNNGKAWLWYARTADNLKTINISLKNASIISPDDPEIVAEIRKAKSATASKNENGVPIKHCLFCWAPVPEDKSVCHYCHAYLDIPDEFFGTMFSGRQEEPDLKIIMESFQKFTKATILNHDKAWLHFCLAMVHVNLNQWDEAREELKLAAEMEPDNGSYRDKIEILSEFMNETKSFSDRASLPRPDAKSPEIGENGKSIMVVEDSKTTRTVIRKMLTPKGYNVIEAGDGIEAIARFGEKTPDLILLDILMPGMDGYQTLATLKKMHDLSNIPVIMLTAKDTLIDKLRGKMSGSNEYLTKPFNALDLTKKIKEYLG